MKDMYEERWNGNQLEQTILENDRVKKEQTMSINIEQLMKRNKEKVETSMNSEGREETSI